MYCKQCGAEIERHPCPECGFRPQPAAAPSATNYDPAMRALVPVGRSGYAIAAGYLGLLGIIVPLLGVVAIVMAWKGMKEIQQDPEKTGMGRVWVGFICGGIGTLISLMIIIAMLS